MRNVLLAFALLVAQGFSPVILFAQGAPPDPYTTARFRFGPLALNPTIAIRDVGIDGNVFNEWENPKSDFTATVAPETAFFLRLGRGRLTGKANVGYVFFKEYARERSVNTDTSVRAELPLVHLRPYVAASYLNTRDRPGFEIDARARRFERAVMAGVDLPFTPRTTLGISGRKTTISYASDAVFLGTYLRDVFNRDVQTLTGSLRHKLTPLTTLVVLADDERARFRFSPVRDSNSIRITPGVEFSPFALVNGSAYIGYRKLNTLGSGVPDYRGVVASVELGYTVLGATRFGVSASRDVFYSYEIQQPHYLQTGLTLTATQHVAGPWDVQARWNGQRLEYRQVATAGNATGSGRTDRVTFYGGGIGYRLGHTTRLGLNLDAYRRRSPLTTREYRGFKVGSSLTYGF